MQPRMRVKGSHAESHTNNATHQTTILYSFKRIIGLRYDEILKAVRNQLDYNVVSGPEEDFCLVSCSSGQCLVSPITLSAVVVEHLITSSRLHLDPGESIDGAVVAVPAHFSASQKEATIRAAEAAGVDNVHLLQEPVAAALAYGIDGGTDGETVLVFDWGGGTFDVSVLQAFEGIMEILGTDGNQFLGGDDMDELLVRHVTSQCPDTMQSDHFDLYRRCRAAKEQLAIHLTAEIIMDTNNRIEISRDTLQTICRPLFEKLAHVLQRIGEDLFIEWETDPFIAIESDSTSSEPCTSEGKQNGPQDDDPWAAPPRKISKVVLVGQITRLKMVSDYIRRITGVEPCSSVDPGEAVALGAATQAGILEGSVGSVELMDGSYSIDLHDRTTGFSNWQP